jgi:hypothetical protein
MEMKGNKACPEEKDLREETDKRVVQETPAKLGFLDNLVIQAYQEFLGELVIRVVKEMLEFQELVPKVLRVWMVLKEKRAYQDYLEKQDNQEDQVTNDYIYAN